MRRASADSNLLHMCDLRVRMRTIRIITCALIGAFPRRNRRADRTGGTVLQILIITMREGIEAFLIVAITAGILRQTGRAGLLPALYWGTGIAIGVSFIASWFFSQAENKPLWEGFLAAAAAVMVVTMTVYMWRTARTMRKSIGTRIELAT